MLVLERRTKQTYFDKITNSADRTQAGIKVSIHHFERFAQVTHKATDEDIIRKLDSLDKEVKEHAVWDVLQSFINYLSKQGLQPSSTSQVCNRVRAYVSYRLSIKLHNDDAKENLTQPKQPKRKNHPLTIEEIKIILDHARPKRKVLYVFLLSSGVRIMEACQLRKRDFTKRLSRYKVHIPAKYTKTKEERFTFISKECEDLLGPILEKLKDDDPVFATNSNAFKAEQNEEMYFTRLRAKAGLTDRYDSGTSKISLHSFRSFFISRCDRVDMGLGHALAGHGHYMKQYERFTEQELLDFYIKAEPKLSIYGINDDSDALKQRDARIENLEKSIMEIKKEQQKTKFASVFATSYYEVMTREGMKPMSGDKITQHAENLAKTLDEKGLLDTLLNNPPSQAAVLEVIKKMESKT